MSEQPALCSSSEDANSFDTIASARADDKIVALGDSAAASHATFGMRVTEFALI